MSTPTTPPRVPVSELRIYLIRSIRADLETALANVDRGDRYGGRCASTDLADLTDLARRASGLNRDTAHMVYRLSDRQQ